MTNDRLNSSAKSPLVIRRRRARSARPSPPSTAFTTPRTYDALLQRYPELAGVSGPGEQGDEQLSTSQDFYGRYLDCEPRCDFNSFDHDSPDDLECLDRFHAKQKGSLGRPVTA